MNCWWSSYKNHPGYSSCSTLCCYLLSLLLPHNSQLWWRSIKWSSVPALCDKIDWKWWEKIELDAAANLTRKRWAYSYNVLRDVSLRNYLLMEKYSLSYNLKCKKGTSLIRNYYKNERIYSKRIFFYIFRRKLLRENV